MLTNYRTKAVQQSQNFYVCWLWFQHRLLTYWLTYLLKEQSGRKDLDGHVSLHLTDMFKGRGWQTAFDFGTHEVYCINTARLHHTPSSSSSSSSSSSPAAIQNPVTTSVVLCYYSPDGQQVKQLHRQFKDNTNSSVSFMHGVFQV